MTSPALTITNEQVNSLPLLLGLMIDMGLRELIDSHVTPHGNWEGASVGTLLCIWLSHILQERDHRLWQAMVERLAWQVYVTNTMAETCPVEAVVASDHQQPVQEHSFSRLKTRNLHLRPVFLRDETRIRGLVWLPCLAVRVLVLTEQRLRAALQEQGSALVGLNPASRTQATTQPTTERVIRAFRNLTVTVLSGPDGEQRPVSALHATQQQILNLLGLPPDLYARLGHPPGNLALQMRE